MPIIETTGNLLKSPAQTLVCTVNTVGVMGAGIAKAFKLAYPAMFLAYKKACYNYFFTHQKNFVYDVSEERKILCLPTKHHWMYPSKLEWVETALKDLARRYEDYGITEIAMPALGCKNGGLDWEDVKPLIYQYMDPLPITVYLYPPDTWK
jgi:O-acetyl-ADP-ribose deacetylase (regulator of RNase III)